MPVGPDSSRVGLYSVDKIGVVRDHSAIGFAAIGTGEEHAAGEYMSYAFTNRWPLYPTMALTYAAKRRAEIAPGVGKTTDMFLINKFGWQRVDQATQDKLTALYDDNEKKKREIDQTTVNDLLEFAKSTIPQSPSDANSSSPQT
jgi:hypothetical protein